MIMPKKSVVIFFTIISIIMLAGVFAAILSDQDHDGIIDQNDHCPNTPEKTVVDQNGCSIQQFCGQFICGNSCDLADWKNDETAAPNDCKTTIEDNEGQLRPKCVPKQELCLKEGLVAVPDQLINVSLRLDSGKSYWNITLLNIPPGFGVINNTNYLGWCADEFITISQNTNHSANLYSSYDPNLATKCPYCADDDWDMVNYIINHKQGTADDIQRAIWYFIDGGTFPSDPDAQAMVNDALANGESFKPITGQNIVVIVDTGSRQQLTFIEVDP